MRVAGCPRSPRSSYRPSSSCVDDWPAEEQAELIDKIKERWAHYQSQQEEMQKVLADGAAKNEITDWLKRSGWTAHFVHRDLGEIRRGRMPVAEEEEEELRRLISAIDRMFFVRCIE